jgi:DNA-binding NtrC family response regulator
VLEALSLHHWPGNVRELRNAVEAYIALGVVPSFQPRDDGAIESALDGLVDATRTYAEQKDEFVQRFTRVYLERLLRRTGGNQSEAARASGLERSYLGKLIDKLGLRAASEPTSTNDRRRTC